MTKRLLAFVVGCVLLSGNAFAFSDTINPASPADTDPVSQGASQIRNFKQAIIDIFGVPNNAAVSGGVFTIGSDGTVNVVKFGNSTTMNPFNALLDITGGVGSQYGGTACTNQFLRSLNAHALGTCNAVNLASDVTGVLPSSAIPAPASARNLIAGAGNVTTTSTSFVDLTNGSLTFTTAANPVACVVNGSTQNSTAGNTNYFDILVDGTSESGGNGVLAIDAPANNGKNTIGFSWQTAQLTSASHTIKIQWKVQAGTGTVIEGTIPYFLFACHEIH